MAATSTNKLLSIALTPALQRVLFFDNLALGAVNRAREVQLSAAGKGVNVATALAALGHQVWVTGFSGGDSGRLVTQDATQRGVTTAFTRVRQATRICDTIIDSGSGTVTELVEEAATPTPQQLARFTATTLALIDRCNGMALSGTIPPALAGHNLYLPFAKAASRAKIRWVVDSHRDDLLAILPCQPDLAKMNRDELAATLQASCSSDSELRAAARRLLAAGARHLLITDGPRPAWFFDQAGSVWQLHPPSAGSVVNPIGSGDCVTAATLAALCSGCTPLEAVRHGVACGSANTITTLPARFDITTLPELYRQTQITAVATRRRPLAE